MKKSTDGETGLGPALAPKTLLNFLNERGNILLALRGDIPTPPALASLLAEFEIHLPHDRFSTVLDHFNYDTTSSSDQHDVVLLPQPRSTRPGARSYFAGDGGLVAMPRAVAQELGPRSPLLASILRARPTSYTQGPREENDFAEDPFAIGEQISLVSTMQARNSARFTVFGSLEALQDHWFTAKVKLPDGSALDSANRVFAQKVSGWTFQEFGVLQVGRVEHRLDDAGATSTGSALVSSHDASNPPIYRIKNDVVSHVSCKTLGLHLIDFQVFEVEVSEYGANSLQPYRPEEGDELQLELTMLSPFYRLNLEPLLQTPNSTVFRSAFQLPDQHGIFRFEVNYKRPFLSNVGIKREITVRHFAHDEWPRSWQISGGWVWIAGIWTTICAWIAFVGLWLWSAPVNIQNNIVKKKQ